MALKAGCASGQGLLFVAVWFWKQPFWEEAQAVCGGSSGEKPELLAKPASRVTVPEVSDHYMNSDGPAGKYII